MHKSRALQSSPEYILEGSETVNPRSWTDTSISHNVCVSSNTCRKISDQIWYILKTVIITVSSVLINIPVLPLPSLNNYCYRHCNNTALQEPIMSPIMCVYSQQFPDSQFSMLQWILTSHAQQQELEVSWLCSSSHQLIIYMFILCMI